jgi:hypothetical protein
MGSTRMLAPALVLLAAMACSSVSTTTKSKPAPAPAPASAHAQKQGKSTAATLGIPPGHLPPPGQCRVWMPGEPPGHQAKARSCANIERSAPAGSWIVYRPTEDKKVVHVKVVDQTRPGIVVHVRVYDVASGSLIREG